MMDQEIKDQQGITTEDSSTTDLVVGTETMIVLVTSAAPEGENVVVGEEEEEEDGGVEKSKETEFEMTSSKEEEEEEEVVLSVDKKLKRANVVVEESAQTQTCVIDVKCSNIHVGKLEENCDVEKVCRICHLSADPPTENSDIIQLGCGCKDELGIAHRHCAETWFKLKGNRCCEICGEAAKNITGMWDDRFMEDWNDRRSVGSNSLDRRWGFWRGQPFCNFLMACLVMAFVLPWFFRVNMF